MFVLFVRLAQLSRLSAVSLSRRPLEVLQFRLAAAIRLRFSALCAANAENNNGLRANNLVVKTAFATKAQRLSVFASVWLSINKRMSHITVVVALGARRTTEYSLQASVLRNRVGVLVIRR